MDNETQQRELIDASKLEKLSRGLRLHGWSYVCAGAGLIACSLIWPGALPVFWILAGWAVPLAVHFFYVKSVGVNDEWADERAKDLRLKSYDYGHIKQIQESYDKTRKNADR